LFGIDFAEDVAAYFVGDDENNQQTPDEVLVSILTSLPDEKLTDFALRLALTGHTDIPRESDFNFLAEAGVAVVLPPPPKNKKRQRGRPLSSNLRPRRAPERRALPHR
jgi:ParB family chromosome partitioning protein